MESDDVDGVVALDAWIVTAKAGAEVFGDMRDRRDPFRHSTDRALRCQTGDVKPVTRGRTLYVSDLDQTLLRSNGTLGDRSIELLNGAIAGGALFTFATARSYDSARRATAALKLRLPVITYGGTVTADPATGAASDLRFLSPSVVSAFIAASRDFDRVAPIAHTFDGGRDWIRWDPVRVTPGVERFLTHRRGDRRLRPITDSDPIDITRVHYVAVLAARSDLVRFRDAMVDVLADAAHFLSEYAHTPGLSWFEFHHPDGTKAHAIRRLAAAFDVGRLVVFGDNHNDLPMFEIADEAYAVGNAVPELAAVASASIGHHDSDAVAEFIAADFVRASRM